MATRVSDIEAQVKRREEVLRQIKITAKVCLPEGTEIFIFGSQANRNTLKAADIDLGIQGKQPIDIRILADFRMMLEALPNLYTFDVVDFGRVSGQFKKVALDNIEVLSV